MAESLHHDARTDALHEQLRGTRVPEIVNPDSRQAMAPQDVLERARNVAT